MISTIILTYNEEEVLEDAIKSLQGFTDEVIIIDSNSTDGTIKIAKKFGARIIERELENFSEQRNLGAKNARGDWIFYLDSDERLTEDFKKDALQKIKAYDPAGTIGGFYIKRRTYYFGKDWHLTDKVQRLFYKNKFNKWYGVVHETPKIEGRFETIQSPILHFTHRTLSQMLEKTNKWSEYEAELRYKAHHPKMTWWRFPRVMISEFFKSYFKNNGYRNKTTGLVESIYQSFSIFVTYAKLWELQNKK